VELDVLKTNPARKQMAAGFSGLPGTSLLVGSGF
jgi:hypothetical protein